jgi:undecaprenyl-diphosphatase
MQALITIDQQLFLFINHLPHTEFTNQVAQFFSGVGTWGVIWLGLTVLLFLREEKRDHWFFLPPLLVMAGTTLSEYILKWIVARPRPTAEMGALIVGHADNFSFPSTHATFAFAFATVIAYEKRRWKWWVYTLAVCIALSRVYLGVHYPLDIVAGALLGWVIGRLALWMSRKKLSHRVKKKEQTLLA